MIKKILLATIVIILSLTIVVMSQVYSSRVYAGISVAGVNVGGKTKSEIASILSLWQNEYRKKHITLYYGDEKFRLASENIDLAIDEEKTLNQIYNYGRKGPVLNRLKEIMLAKQQGYNVPIHVRYNKSKLDGFFYQMQGVVEKPVRNAAISLVAGGVVPEEQGKKIDLLSLKPLVLDSLQASSGKCVPLPIVVIHPEVTELDIARMGVKEVLAVYTTYFNEQDSNRSFNIKLAADKINGQIVYPNNRFSFNEIVGARDKKYGFKEALEIVNGEFVPGVGGGVCQVSSTLYNAVLLANLKIIERYNHAKPLGYIPLGRDATVVYNMLDFCFENNLNQPIMVMAEVNKNELTVGVVGAERLKYNIDIVGIDKKVITPPVIKVQDDSILLGDSIVEKKGTPGYEITIVRIIKKNGLEVKREVVSRDRYLPDKTVVKVGTQKPSFLDSK